MCTSRYLSFAPVVQFDRFCCPNQTCCCQTKPILGCHALCLGHKQYHYCFQGHLLGIQGTFLSPVAQVAIDLSEGCDPAVKKNASRILKELQLEEERFSSTLGTGQKLLTDILQQVRPPAAPILCHMLPDA